MSASDYPDHGRVLALLWRGPDEPSRRSGLTVGRIVAAAIDIADEAGIDSLSMRRIAEQLGVGVMSLYTYVASKAELIPVMVDTVLAELPNVPEPDRAPDSPHSTPPWRQQLEAVATARWELYGRHPWVLAVPEGRPTPGPNGLDRYEEELRVVDGIGLDEWEMNATLESLHSHTAGAAQRAAEIARDAKRSGISDDQWWYSVEPLFTRYFASHHAPVSERVGTVIAAPHSDPLWDLNFGLARLLDGVEHLVASRHPTDQSRSVS